MEFNPGDLGNSLNIELKEFGDKLNNELNEYSGTIGYKIPRCSIPNTENIPTFVIITDNHGVILIDYISSEIEIISEKKWKIIDTDKYILSRDIVLDNFEIEIGSRCKDEDSLYDRESRKTKFEVNKILLFSRKYNNSKNIDFRCKVSSNKDIIVQIKSILSSDKDDIDYGYLYQCLEGTDTYGSEKSKSEELLLMRDYIEEAKREYVKLDEQQRIIAYQVPNGPQRIRGLAGTGKTIILTMKAANTHINNADYHLLYLFNTRSLYNLIEDKITNYYIKEKREPINRERLKIYHAWGGDEQPGLYSWLCDQYGIRRIRYGEVRKEKNPLKKIYEELLKNIRDKVEPYFDMVIIDEAQDLPKELFETVYYLTKSPKRIVWAYDEFQTLNDNILPEPNELFGKKDNGEPNISDECLQENDYGEIKRDIALLNCYRNPRLNLMIAHALGLGLYRKEGIIDMIENRSTWEAYGYEVIIPKSESYEEGEEIIIERPEKEDSNKLEKILRTKIGDDYKNLVSLKKAADEDSQIEVVTNLIKDLVVKEKVKQEEICVINLGINNAKNDFIKIRQKLNNDDIKCITPGYIESADKFIENGKIILTTPFRAKGNEVSVVIIMNSQECISDTNYWARSAMFVSITRAKTWCYIVGVEDGQFFEEVNRMDILEEEINKIKNNYPKLLFKYPSKERIIKSKRILNKSLSEINRIESIMNKINNIDKELLVRYLKKDKDIQEYWEKDDTNNKK